MEKTWHADHFSCHTCDKRFTAETGYHELEAKPYCEPCYSDKALPKCKGCSKPIKDKAIKALNAEWHLACFVCKVGDDRSTKEACQPAITKQGLI